MGFLDAQLAQGYALAYAQRAGLLDSEQRKEYNTIINGVQMADNILSLGLETRKTKIERPARQGEYRIDTAKEIRSRIAQYQRSAGEFRIKLYYRANRVMTREERYKRDNNIRSNRKIPKEELDSWEIRTAATRAIRRAIIRRIILRTLAEEIIKNIAQAWLTRGRSGRGILRSLNRLRKEIRAISRLWRVIRTAERAARDGRAYNAIRKAVTYR